MFPCLFPSDLMVKLFLGKGTRMAELCLLINHSDVNWNIVCVYAPTQPAQTNCFLRSLHRSFSLVPVSLFVVILIVTRTCVISLVVTPFLPLNLQILNRILVELMCGGLKIRVCLSLLGSIPIFLLLAV